jgi:uncharacterized protein (TIGR02611 family)
MSPTAEAPRPHVPTVVRRLRERRATHRDHGPVYRALFVTAGFLVLLVGLAMLALPGPAFLIIPIGLAILSLEFAWAGTLLDATLLRAARAREQAARTTRRQRVLTGAAGVLALAALIAAAVAWDIPVLPV